MPPEQAKFELEVVCEESQVTKIDRFLPVGSMNVHSAFHAKTAISFLEILRSHKEVFR